jgi:DNA-binding HxlR family transcriptional regulator
MSRRNPKRSSSGRFARLPLTLLATPAVTTLSHAAFRVLVLLAAQYTGYNNGALGITRNQAAQQGIGSDHTLYGSLRDLETRELIERTYHASRVPPRPAMYALTWVSVDDTEYSRSARLATHAYREWQPTPKAARRRKPRLTVVRSADL